MGKEQTSDNIQDNYLTIDNSKRVKITLTLNNSPESRALKRIMENREIPFHYFYSSGDRDKLPIFETAYGTIRGWHNIKVYLLSPEEGRLIPEDYDEEYDQ